MTEDPLAEFNKQYDPQNFVPKYEGGSVSSSSTDGNYDYIAQLLFHPVKDGRHRLSFMILPQYMVNILGLSDEEAFEAISSFLKACESEEPTDARGRLAYYIQYARRTGYKPPFLETVREKDPDLYIIIMDAITAK